MGDTREKELVTAWGCTQGRERIATDEPHRGRRAQGEPETRARVSPETTSPWDFRAPRREFKAIYVHFKEQGDPGN